MRTGHFEDYNFPPPDPAAAWLALHDPLALYKKGEKKGKRKSAASVMWEFERGHLPQGVRLPGNDSNENDDEYDWIENQADNGESVFDAGEFRPGEKAKKRTGGGRGLSVDHWNALLSLAPADLPDRDVLVLSSQHGDDTLTIAQMIGRSRRQVQYARQKLLEWAATLDPIKVQAHLEDEITTESVERRPAARTGRKARAAVQVGAPIVITDLCGDVIPFPQKDQVRPPAGPRRTRRPRVHPGQMELPWAA